MIQCITYIGWSLYDTVYNIHRVELVWCHWLYLLSFQWVFTSGDVTLDHSTNHLQNTWYFVSDLQWRGVSIKFSSLRTRWNIDTPLHCQSDTNYHLFCKYNILYMYINNHCDVSAPWGTLIRTYLVL
jgi:hypothetical protein